MAPATGALLVAVGIGGDVEDDIVRATRRYSTRDIVQIERMAHFPRDDVVGAGRVPADADGSDELSCRVIERQSAAEDITPRFSSRP